MNYIPGTAQIELKKQKNNKKCDVYEISVECDANDGDYMHETWIVDSFDEIDTLMIAYLQLNHYDIPQNWKDTVEAYKNDCNYSFGGTYLADNWRFNKPEEKYSWIERWAYENDYLLYAGMCDSCCHSIESIDVIYYDETGTICDCIFPDLGELFDSEEEFISYIRQLIDKEK